MTGLAPKFLVDNAMAFDGKQQTKPKRDEYKQWNVLSFGGGSQFLEYEYGLDGSTAENVVTIDKSEEPADSVPPGQPS